MPDDDATDDTTDGGQEMPDEGDAAEDAAAVPTPDSESGQDADASIADGDSTAASTDQAEAATDGDGEADATTGAEATLVEGADTDATDEGADGADGSDAAKAGAAGVPAEVLAAIGDGAEQVAEFGGRAAAALLVGLESVAEQVAELADVRVALSDYAAIEAEFTSVEHVGLELRVALSETEAYLAAALLPLDSISALLRVDASAEQMADAEFAQAQIETLSNSARELLDHLSITLATDALEGAEVSLSEARLGQIDFTVGMVADVAQGAEPVRLDLTLALPDGGTAAVTMIVPSNLLTRLAELLGEPQEADAELLDQPPAGDEAANVTPLRPEGFESAFPPPPVPGITDGSEVPVHPVRFPPLGESTADETQRRSIDLLMDVSMRVSVELGRSTMTVESVLALGPGSVVELNKLAGEPVDVMINERLIARGEVVVVDENFGVRVTEIVSPRTRANTFGR